VTESSCALCCLRITGGVSDRGSHESHTPSCPLSGDGYGDGHSCMPLLQAPMHCSSSCIATLMRDFTIQCMLGPILSPASNLNRCVSRTVVQNKPAQSRDMQHREQAKRTRNHLDWVSLSSALVSWGDCPVPHQVFSGILASIH
jgi:hypothetical protein